MKSSCNKEDTSKKYASFTNSKSAKITKTSVTANQYKQPWQQQRHNVEPTKVDVPNEKSDIKTKTLDNLYLHHSIKPCPFTFLTAIKRKLALGGNHPTCKKAYEPEKELPESNMEFIKSLKVPNVKISPKADYSSRESILSNEELSKKMDAVQRDEMHMKCTDRVPRKLEFTSSSATSLLNYENVEPLKIPDFTILKKKDLSRDSSREKENRSKRVKKDDFNTAKNKEDLEDLSKWTKNQRHVSRKEIAESIVNRKLKNDRILAHGPKDSDLILKKSKNKSLSSAKVKKDEETRLRYSNIPSNKTKKDKSLDSRNRNSSSDSIYPLDKGAQLHDKILIREGYKAIISDNNDRKYKDDSQIVSSSKTSDEQKHKSHSETRIQKHQNKSNPIKPIESLSRDQVKRIVDKQKSSSKADSKHSSEISEDLTTAVTSIASLVKSQGSSTEIPSSLPSKNKDSERTSLSNNSQINTEEPKYSDTFSHVSSSNLNSSMIETKFSQDSSLYEKIMDPVMISFREDNYSNPPEFEDLVTPDINLTIRSKKRKPFQAREYDVNHKDIKHSPTKNSQNIDKTQMMQLKAEMNLLDSFSESLRQAIDVERSRISSDELKRHSVSTQNDLKDMDSKRTESDSIDSKEDRIQKPSIKVVEVQTQTANDIATQTDAIHYQRGINTSLAYSRVNPDKNDIQHISLNSEDRYEDMDRVEDISLPSKMRTMSEISLHETTSSIKTETGTEISISTRDVTCSFNKYLDLEMAQLIKDERQRYDKIEMLFKSREKTLNDRTKKLVKLEEQKRALRDTGQDSRISSVKKKQRALLLKLQQEKDEMNRLKELHKIASQERKLMLQKQRDMFNPEMSTKNILNKLKRSADCQSPRRLSGPMKGYDIRSNSSISSLVDSDKSQFDLKLNLSDIAPQKNDLNYSRLELDSSLKQGMYSVDNIDKRLTKFESSKQQKDSLTTKLKYDLKTRKFEEKMPKSDLLKLKSHQHDLDALLKHGAAAMSLLKNDGRPSVGCEDDSKLITDPVKSESDALIEEFTQIWKSQFPNFESESLNLLEASDSVEVYKEIDRPPSSKRLDKDSNKKLQHTSPDNKIVKRKGPKIQKAKSSPIESTSKSEDSHLDEVFKHHYKRSKIDSEQQSDENYQNSILEELDFNESQSSLQALLKHSHLLKERNQELLQDIVNECNGAAGENSESPLSQKDDDDNVKAGNTSARSQVSFTISHQSSNDSDRSYSKSVVIRSQQDHHHHTSLKTSKKLEQILNAREATLVSRRNCVEEWISWHARLREEENRVARMEQAAYKLVSATAKALSHNDTTVSSDTSDVEGRIELLTQKLADRRLEMARLKREARKQAKQRLRALEANLLNQIKKYDATIHEMRKKLEIKRVASKESEKLAIESRSVADFKVPEIPIKKIQEIYKSSDLLRSKSDSDIISSKIPGNNEKSKDDKVKTNHGESRSSTESKALPSLYTVYDDHESSEKSDYSAVHSHKTKSNSEEIATQKSITSELQEIRRSSSQSSNISEEIPSEAYSVKSQIDQIQNVKISDALSSQYISERIDASKSLKESSNIEDLTPESDNASLVYSKKLDHIQLHNKELNDDILNLENDLRELTELMSNFSKKTEEKNSKSIQNPAQSKSSEKSTANDISKELPVSELTVQTNNIDEDLQTRVKKILSDVIPETDDLVTSIEELDNKVKSIESLGKVDKSTTRENVNKSISEEISTYIPSHSIIHRDEHISGRKYDNDIHSISEVISIIEEDKENVSPHESQNIALKVNKSSDGVVSSQIETEYYSDFEKMSSAYLQDTIESSIQKKSQISIEHYVESTEIDEQVGEDSTVAKDNVIDTNISTVEDIPNDQLISSKLNETENEIKTITEDKQTFTNDETTVDKVESSTINEIVATINNTQSATENKNENKVFIAEEVNDLSENENIETENTFAKTGASDNDWPLSDSLSIQPIEDKDCPELQLDSSNDFKINESNNINNISDIENSMLFLPKGESTTIQDNLMLQIEESSESLIGIRSDEFNDILEIIERETKNDKDDEPGPQPAILYQNENLPKLDVKFNKPIEYDVSVTVKTKEDKSESIEEEFENKNEMSQSENLLNEKELTENDEDLPQIEIGVKIEVIGDEEDEKSKDESKASSLASLHSKKNEIHVSEVGESSGEERSSDGEQLDNLIEVAEGKLATLEKLVHHNKKLNDTLKNETLIEKPKTHVTVFLDRTFEVIKDPEYEDISEESLEVSEILDKSELRINQKTKKFTTMPEKYVIKSKSDEVLRILDEISNKSLSTFKDNCDTLLDEKNNLVNSANSNILQKFTTSPEEKLGSVDVKSNEQTETQENSTAEFSKDELIIEEIKSTEAASPKIETDLSEVGGLDTPGGVSEIDTDSPRDVNDDSRLDVEALDDDLLSGNSLLLQNQANDAKTEFRTTPMGVTSEKDIEAMIDKLRASLEQPGLEVAELEAKLLQIENLEIELEIKKLEAEEVSYYVREIPNKPPPPYTPPGAVRLPSSHGSPSPPPVVIPTNVEELTVITEKATTIIYQAKQTGEDILSLEAPTEICELAKDNSTDALKKDRRIYNTFLFDLCKELIAEMYKTEYETPGPSWTKPNVKTKSSVKVARNVEELNDYVSKEVATLFGFKTKLQRENMVMRWSRKRRDRVDELLAKEAQAEEKEWTKFHHDELSVKNGLTLMILDTLVVETTKCVKAAYAKKKTVVA